MTWFRLMLFALCTALACVPDDPDLEGRPCPCVDDYVCFEGACTRNPPVEDDGGPAFDSSTLQDTLPDQGTLDIGGEADAFLGEDVGPRTDAGPGPDAGPQMDAGMQTDADPVMEDAGPTLSFCERHGAGTHVCLDFDEDVSAAWMLVESGGEAAYDSTRAVSGRSLRVTAGSMEAAHFERLNVGNVSSGTVWLRMRVYVESGGSDNAYFPFLSLSQRLTEPYAYFGLALAGGPGRIRTALSRGALGFEDATSVAGAFRNGRWLCVESEFNVSVSTDVVTYLNGSEITRFTAVTAGTFDRIHVGADEAGDGQVERTIWLDDVVWSPTRVSCALE